MLLNCQDKEDLADIVIPEVQKVEDTIPGWFIKAMNLDYSSGKSVTILMHEHLAKFGTHIDKFKDKNDDLHIICLITGVIPYQNHRGKLIPASPVM